MNTRNVIIGGALSALSIAGIIILRSLPWTKKHVKKQSKNKPTTVKGWGSNSSGQMSLGYAGNGPDYVLKIGQFSNLTNIKYISSGPYHTLVLLENGTLLGCGSNSFGKLCRNADVNAVYTIRVMDMLTNVVDVAAGPSFNIAVTKDGKVWSWGSNNKGQLGIGSDDYDLVVETPTEVTALRNQKITKVYAGGFDQYNKGGFAFALTGMYFTIFVNTSRKRRCMGLGK
jgi:alpha-tubulin suppressor-like RCC1 family protein